MKKSRIEYAKSVLEIAGYKVVMPCVMRADTGYLRGLNTSGEEVLIVMLSSGKYHVENM